MKPSFDPSTLKVLVTCEHASNRISPKLRGLFEASELDLASHRAWDPGALPLAKYLSRQIHAPLIVGRYSRLVIDLNRPTGHRDLFSSVTRNLSADVKHVLEETLHRPYYGQALQYAIRNNPTLHLSIHSFTPVLDGQIRNTDVALLYDPTRSIEQTIATGWLKELARMEPTLRLRRNFPYRGTSASLTSSLRKMCTDKSYAGIELEICNELPTHARWPQIRRNVVESLKFALRPTHIK